MHVCEGGDLIPDIFIYISRIPVRLSRGKPLSSRNHFELKRNLRPVEEPEVQEFQNVVIVPGKACVKLTQ